jgi:glycosyltransferase involved in cell wall biosynthesis
VPLVSDGVTFQYFRRQWRQYNVSLPLKKWLATHIAEYDLIHIHALFSFTTLWTARYAQEAGKPYVVTPHGSLNRWGLRTHKPWLKALSLAFIERGILSGASVIHYLSEWERSEAARLGIVNRTIVIPNCVEPIVPSGEQRHWLSSRFTELRDQRIILFVGRLDAIKGLDLLLQAFAKLRKSRSDVSLVFAGQGTAAFERELRREARRLEVASSVYWLGFLSPGECASALTDADVFVLPSYSESFGTAVVEALAFGVPVVISDRVGMKDLVGQAGAGLVVPCDAGELANAILELLGDETLRARCRANGLALARQFSVETVTSQLLTAYHAAMDNMV